MGSMFAKLQKNKVDAADEFRLVYLREIAAQRPNSYYICTDADDGHVLAMGELDAIKEQLGTDYTTRSVKYFRHDRITDTVKAVM